MMILDRLMDPKRLQDPILSAIDRALIGQDPTPATIDSLAFLIQTNDRLDLYGELVSYIKISQRNKPSTAAYSLTELYANAVAFCLREKQSQLEDICESLRSAGLDINDQDLNGRTPISHAYSMGASHPSGREPWLNLALLDHLHRAGADPSIPDHDANTAANHIRNAKVFEYVLSHRTSHTATLDLTAKNRFGETPLHSILLADTTDKARVVSLAAEASLDLEAPDNDGSTIFEKLSALSGDDEMENCTALIELLKRGAASTMSDDQKIALIFKHGLADDFATLGIDVSRAIASEDLYAFALVQTTTLSKWLPLNPLEVARDLGADILADYSGRNLISLARRLRCPDKVIQFLQAQMQDARHIQAKAKA